MAKRARGLPADIARMNAAPAEPSAEVAAMMAAEKPQTSEGELARLRKVMARGRELELQIADMEAALKELKRERYELTTSTLPDMFDAAKVDRLGLDSDGNLPAFDARMKMHYHAVLPKDGQKSGAGIVWPDGARAAALELLRDKNAGDLITTEVTVDFQRGEDAQFTKLRSFLEKAKLDYTSDAGVLWQKLTAWVREKYESGSPLDPDELKTLNATVHRTVELKERKG